jgi:hypothetical protein
VGIADTYMTDAVTITPKGTRGADGKYAYSGTPVVTTARVVNKNGVRRYGTDTEWVYALMLWMAADETIALQDQLTIDGQKYRVKELVEQDNIAGTLDHYEVYCG